MSRFIGWIWTTCHTRENVCERRASIKLTVGKSESRQVPYEFKKWVELFLIMKDPIKTHTASVWGNFVKSAAWSLVLYVQHELWSNKKSFRGVLPFLLMFEDSGFDKCVFDKLQCCTEPWSSVTFCVVICFVCAVQGKIKEVEPKLLLSESLCNIKKKKKNSKMVLPSKINPTAVTNSTTHRLCGMRNVSVFASRRSPSSRPNFETFQSEIERSNSVIISQSDKSPHYKHIKMQIHSWDCL